MVHYELVGAKVTARLAVKRLRMDALSWPSTQFR